MSGDKPKVKKFWAEKILLVKAVYGHVCISFCSAWLY